MWREYIWGGWLVVGDLARFASRLADSTSRIVTSRETLPCHSSKDYPAKKNIGVEGACEVALRLLVDLARGTR